MSPAGLVAPDDHLERARALLDQARAEVERAKLTTPTLCLDALRLLAAELSGASRRLANICAVLERWWPPSPPAA